VHLRSIDRRDDDVALVAVLWSLLLESKDHHHHDLAFRCPHVLLVVVVLCALSVVTSQHKARKLFIELQKEKEFAQQLEVEWGQLQLEQSTWATPARVEEIAGKQLHMQLPKSGQVKLIRTKSDGGVTQQQ